MKSKKRFFLAGLLFALVLMGQETALAHSVPGPESDQHNTVYSYNISEVALDASHMQLHVTMNVHMCPFCSPHNNYVKVNVAGIGTKSTTNTPVGVTCTRSFTFDAPNLRVGDIVQIYSDVWCEWCGHWYDSRKFRVEPKVIETPGLGGSGPQCTLTLVEIGSAVNIANGNLYDSYGVSPEKRLPLEISYNSQSVREGRFGYGWHDSLDYRLLKKNDGSMILIRPDGAEEAYTLNPDGTFSPPAGNRDILTAAREIVFSDDMESGTGEWVAEAPWSQINFAYHSPGTAWTDSPGGYYDNNVHSALTLPLDLSGTGGAVMTFWHAFLFETYYDFGYIEISQDGGASWTMLDSYTGPQNYWTKQRISLDRYAGLPDLLLRFRVITDESVVDDGWYIDDVEITGVTGYVLQRKNGDIIYFDNTGRPVSMEDRNGNTTAFAYAGDFLESVTDPYGRSLFFENDGVEMTAVTDQLGRSFTFEYDPEGNLAAITDPAGSRRTFGYDAEHNLIAKTDPAGGTAQYVYDDQDRLISATDAEGVTRTLTYEAPGLTAFTDPAGNRTEYEYNENFNVTRKTDPLGNVSETEWDDDMNRLRVTDASGTVTFTYDDAGNRLTRTDRMGNTTHFTYDRFGNVLTATDADGHVTANTYDENGNLVSSTDPEGRTVTYTYDDRGRLVEKADALGRTTAFAYDAAGNLIAVTGPDGLTVTMTYDAAGNRITETVSFRQACLSS